MKHHFFSATLTKIHYIKIDIWSQISLNIPLKEYISEKTPKGLLVSKRRRIKNVVKLQKNCQKSQKLLTEQVP